MLLFSVALTPLLSPHIHPFSNLTHVCQEPGDPQKLTAATSQRYTAPEGPGMGLKPTRYWLELEGFPEKGTLVVCLRGWVVLRQTERGSFLI